MNQEAIKSVVNFWRKSVLSEPLSISLFTFCLILAVFHYYRLIERVVLTSYLAMSIVRLADSQLNLFYLIAKMCFYIRCCFNFKSFQKIRPVQFI